MHFICTKRQIETKTQIFCSRTNLRCTIKTGERTDGKQKRRKTFTAKRVEIRSRLIECQPTDKKL